MADLDESTTTVTPMWEEDKNAKNCSSCEAKFTMTRRKHHCRVCGRIFCDTCSNHRDVLPPAFELKGPQRTCDACHLNLQKAKADEDPSSVPERPDIDVVKKEIIEGIEKILADPEETWVKKVDKRGVVLHAKKIKDSSLVCVRSVVHVKAPLEKTFGIYNDKAAWRNWQPDMLKCTTVEERDAASEFIYILYNVPVLNNRDVCVFSQLLPGFYNDASKERALTLISKSVVHPLCPGVKGCVRAIINLGFTQFEEITVDGKPETVITAIFHTDPRGIVPPRVVNATIGKGAAQVADMADFIAKTDYPDVDAVASLISSLSVSGPDAAPPATALPAGMRTDLV